MIEIERWKITKNFIAVRYKLLVPRPWLQKNWNDMFGPQTEIIQLERT